MRFLMNEQKIVLMLADGFEEVEAVTTIDLLRRAGISIETVSIMEKETVAGAHGILITADKLMENVNFQEADMIVLPGGMPGTTNLLNCAPLKDALLAFASEGKLIAAICAAPMVLAAHGILSGKKATIYEGMEANLNDAIFAEGNVIEDGNIITSKGPGTAMDFGLALIRKLRGKEASDEVKKGLLYQG